MDNDTAARLWHYLRFKNKIASSSKKYKKKSYLQKHHNLKYSVKLLMMYQIFHWNSLFVWRYGSEKVKTGENSPTDLQMNQCLRSFYKSRYSMYDCTLNLLGWCSYPSYFQQQVAASLGWCLKTSYSVTNDNNEHQHSQQSSIRGFCKCFRQRGGKLYHRCCCCLSTASFQQSEWLGGRNLWLHWCSARNRWDTKPF